MFVYDYTRRASGLVPYVKATLSINGNSTPDQSALVDSGAVLCLAPMYLLEQIDSRLAALPKKPTGLVAANNAPIAGVPYLVEVNVQQLPTARQEFWFSDEISFVMLGQSWFEQVAVLFTNFETVHGKRVFTLTPKADYPYLIVP